MPDTSCGLRYVQSWLLQVRIQARCSSLSRCEESLDLVEGQQFLDPSLAPVDSLCGPLEQGCCAKRSHCATVRSSELPVPLNSRFHSQYFKILLNFDDSNNLVQRLRDCLQLVSEISRL